MIYWGKTMDTPVRVLGGNALDRWARIQTLGHGTVLDVKVSELTATGGIFEIERAIKRANAELSAPSNGGA
jgi:hypothetical protein